MSEQALNQFLSSHAVIAIDREFCNDGDTTGWSVCVSWNESQATVDHCAGQLKRKRDAIDYREVLGEDDFAVYASLRDLRKQIADESGQFVYQIFSNKQLAEMVTRRVSTETAMGEIPTTMPTTATTILASAWSQLAADGCMALRGPALCPVLCCQFSAGEKKRADT